MSQILFFRSLIFLFLRIPRGFREEQDYVIQEYSVIYDPSKFSYRARTRNIESFQILEIWLNFKFNFAYGTRVTGWKQFYYSIEDLILSRIPVTRSRNVESLSEVLLDKRYSNLSLSLRDENSFNEIFPL